MSTSTRIGFALLLTVAILCAADLNRAQAAPARDYLLGVNVHNPRSVVTIVGGAGLTAKDVIVQSGMPFGSIVRATGTAVGEMKFGGGSECALQALPSPGAQRFGQVTTRVPPGALFSLNGGVANCTVSKAPQDLSVCGTGAVYDNSNQSQFNVSCSGDPLFAVAVLHGSVKVLAPNGKKTSVAAGKELTCNPAKCVPVTKRATFTPAQQSIFTTQAKQLGLPITTQTSTTTTTAIAPASTITPNGSPVTATVSTPGRMSVFTFEGTKGQQVSLRYSGSSFVNSRDEVNVLDPAGNGVIGGGLDSGHGFIPAGTLQTTGTYQVVVDTSATSDTGKVTIQLYEFSEQTGSITPNGPAVTAKVRLPIGQKVVYHFRGTKGEQVSFRFSGNSFLDHSDPIGVIGPDGNGVTGGSLDFDHGFLAPATLQTTGTYQVVVDTSATGDTGKVTIQLYEFSDQTGSITPNGPAVTAKVRSAGQTITYDFTGTKGEQVTISYSGDTFPTSNDLISLLAPDGSQVDNVYLASDSGSLARRPFPPRAPIRSLSTLPERATSEQ